MSDRSDWGRGRTEVRVPLRLNLGGIKKEHHQDLINRIAQFLQEFLIDRADFFALGVSKQLCFNGGYDITLRVDGTYNQEEARPKGYGGVVEVYEHLVEKWGDVIRVLAWMEAGRHIPDEQLFQTVAKACEVVEE